jgi:hypothetical protein
MMKALAAIAGLVLMIAASNSSDSRADQPTRLAQNCAALRGALAAEAPAGPVLIASYRAGPDEQVLPAGIRTSAFVYDNALAAIALIACGELAAARRVGDALAIAASHDRSFADGRIRNAYRAGPVQTGAAPALPGWWDHNQSLWAEDPAQDGTSTGNVAWAALALLALHQASGDGGYLHAARTLVDWIIAQTSTGQGFSGGVHGFDPQQVRLTWISTEHNVDVHAAAIWLLRLTGEAKYQDAARQARAFLDRAFVGDHFLMGTRPDGALAEPSALALDVQLWPWIADPDAPPAWRTAMSFAEKRLGVAGGFDFNGDRDGLWVEGTAQASLGYKISGDAARGDALLAGLEQDRSDSGLLFATRVPRLSTGLAIDPTSTKADFDYFRRPHLGATGWAVLAEAGFNPFTGRKIR